MAFSSPPSVRTVPPTPPTSIGGIPVASAGIGAAAGPLALRLGGLLRGLGGRAGSVTRDIAGSPVVQGALGAAAFEAATGGLPSGGQNRGLPTIQPRTAGKPMDTIIDFPGIGNDADALLTALIMKGGKGRSKISWPNNGLVYQAEAFQRMDGTMFYGRQPRGYVIIPESGGIAMWQPIAQSLKLWSPAKKPIISTRDVNALRRAGTAAKRLEREYKKYGHCASRTRRRR